MENKMENKVYFFRDKDGGYFQHPSGNIERVLNEFINKTKGQSQISIHRDGSLTYYGFTRKLKLDESDEPEVAGICIVFSDNKVYADFERLYYMLDKVFSEIVKSKIILQFSESGDIESSYFPLHEQKAEIDRISEIVTLDIYEDLSKFIELPEQNCDISFEQEVYLNDNSNCINEEIINALSSNNNIYIPFLDETNNSLTSRLVEKQRMKYILELNTKLEEENSSYKKIISIFKPLFKFAVYINIVSFFMALFDSAHGNDYVGIMEVIIFTNLAYFLLKRLWRFLFRKLTKNWLALIVWVIYIINIFCSVLINFVGE